MNFLFLGNGQPVGASGHNCIDGRFGALHGMMDLTELRMMREHNRGLGAGEGGWPRGYRSFH
jgi:hypothetical protein